MPCAILIIGAQLPGGPVWTRESGRYLVDFDPAKHSGRGPVPTTADITKAKHFADLGEALEFWRTQSTIRPLRPDGEPNRPLTAFTVKFEPVE